MAIIAELGLEVKFKVNGSTAAEYPDEEPDVDDDAHRQTANICHHYVESVDNAEFAINVGLIPGTNTGQEWVSRSQNHGLSFTVALDGGHNLEAVVIYQRCNTALLEGVHDQGAQTLRKFLFTPVTTGKSPALFEDLEAANPSSRGCQQETCRFGYEGRPGSRTHSGLCPSHHFQKQRPESYFFTP